MDETPNQVGKLIFDFRCLPKQKDVLLSEGGIDFVVAGIGGGKTVIAALKMLYWAFHSPRRKDGRPTHWLALGRDYKVVREQLDEICAHAERCLNEKGEKLPFSSIVARRVGGVEPKIELTNGTVISGYSGNDPDSFRSHAFDGFWMEEADFCAEEAFKMAIRRLRSAECIRGIVTTSPGEDAAHSWVWPHIVGADCVSEFRRHNQIRVHRWTSAENPNNNPEVLAAIRAADPKKAAREIQGLFLGTEVPLECALDFKRAFVEEPLKLTARDARAAVLGVDLGKTQDFTWLTVLGESGVVLAMERFNVSTPGVPREQFYPWVEGRISALVEAWRIPLVKIDVALHGAAFAETLKRALGRRSRVDGYKTDSVRKKADAIEALGVATSRATVRIPKEWIGPDGATRTVAHVDQLKREMQELIVEPRQGFRIFDHPPGGHDDGVVSLALAWEGLSKRPVTPVRDYEAFFGWRKHVQMPEPIFKYPPGITSYTGLYGQIKRMF